MALGRPYWAAWENVDSHSISSGSCKPEAWSQQLNSLNFSNSATSVYQRNFKKGLKARLRCGQTMRFRCFWAVQQIDFVYCSQTFWPRPCTLGHPAPSLRSADQSLLAVPNSKTGNCAFSLASKLCEQLPLHIRHTDSLPVFKISKNTPRFHF